MKPNGKMIDTNPKVQKSNLTLLEKISKIWVFVQFGQIGLKDPYINV